MSPLRRRLPAVVTVLLTAVAVLLGGASGAAPSARATMPVVGAVVQKVWAGQVLVLMNRERSAHGLKPLRSSRTLVAGAAAHNRAMAAVNSITHQTRGERNFLERDRAAGWPAARCGGAENVGVHGERSLRAALQLQTNMYREVAPYDGHRRNILEPRFTHAGVAVLLDPRNGRLWLTVDFGQRRC